MAKSGYQNSETLEPGVTKKRKFAKRSWVRVRVRIRVRSRVRVAVSAMVMVRVTVRVRVSPFRFFG